MKTVKMIEMDIKVLFQNETSVHFTYNKKTHKVPVHLTQVNVNTGKFLINEEYAKKHLL